MLRISMCRQLEIIEINFINTKVNRNGKRQKNRKREKEGKIEGQGEKDRDRNRGRKKGYILIITLPHYWAPPYTRDRRSRPLWRS